MSKIINVGRVTSYADAVAGGYTGTREQWEHDLANLGTVAAEVEADRAEVAENTATVAEDKAAVEEDKSAAKSAAGSAAESAASAHTDAIAATAAKEAAESAQGLAENAASTAANAKDAAQTAQGAAEDAQTAAEAAQTASEDAQTAAEGSATAAAESATAAAESEATAQHIADMYPTDKTLSVVDKAADGKATGDAVADLKSAIFKVVTISEGDWEVGSYNYPNGANYESTSRIRLTKYVGYSLGYLNINALTGYEFSIYAWNASTNEYVGAWMTSNTFAKNGTLKWVSTFDLSDYEGYIVKVALRNASSPTSTMTTDLCINCTFSISEIYELREDVADIREDVADLQSAINSPVFESYGSVPWLAAEQSFNLANNIVTSVSYARMAYAIVDVSYKWLKVTKQAGKSFAVAFTASNPQNNTALISGYTTYSEESSELTVEIPENAKYVCVRYWRSNADTDITSVAMAATITLQYVYGDIDRNNVIATLKAVNGIDKKNVKSNNLFNGNLYSGYVSVNGLCSASASYKFTDAIDVSNHVGETLYFSINGTATNARMVCALDANNIPVSASGSDSSTSTYTVPSGIAKIIPSFAVPVSADLQIEYGGISPHEDYLDDTILDGYPAIDAFVNIGSQVKLSADTLANDEHISHTGEIRIKPNGSTYAMYVKIGESGLGTDGYLIFGRRSYEIGVNNTNLMFFSNEASESSAVAHGLTLKDYVFVTVTIPVDSVTATITIYTNGGTYTRTNTSWGSIDKSGLFSVYNKTGQTVTSVKASWSNSAVRNRLCVMGDSYITLAATRWPYYIIQWGFKDVLYNGYAGETSENGLKDLIQILTLGTPSIICWCYGMNDADSGAINASWLKNVNLFLHYCDVNDITPILATIPCVPSANHSYKNAWVRASGYRYIDFESAVNTAQDATTWYDNMLSSDNVHPDTQGAIALATQFVVDVPEVAAY